MTLAKDMPDHAVLVAIDVAKHRNEILIETPGRVRRRRLTVLNTRADHDRLVETLAAVEAPVVAGFEATGNYHRPLAHRLLAEGVDLRLISSLALARTREAITGGWDKNDPKDAQIILHMARGSGMSSATAIRSRMGSSTSRSSRRPTRRSRRRRPSSGTGSSPTTCRSTSPRPSGSAAMPAATGSSPSLRCSRSRR